MEISAILDSMSKPIIGIVGRPTKEENKFNISVREEYRQALIKLGGISILILPPQNLNYYTTRVSEVPSLTEEEQRVLEKELNLCDGILLPGGSKMSEYDNFIIGYCIKYNKPILGICLGMQEMANFSKNTKEQKDFILEKNNELGINHCNEDDYYVHSVTIDKISKLYSILKEESFKVNSLHNYHVTKSRLYDVVGYSEDGLIEAIEYKDNTFNIGLQWHPERLLEDKLEYKIFEEFIKSCIAKKY